MKEEKKHIILKFTQNDNIKGSDQELGWVDYFVKFLKTGLAYQLENPVEFEYKNELELITKDDFDRADLIFYILSPAMVFSSNLNQDSNELEQAFNFDIPLINSKIKKVFKAPVKIEDLPLSLSTPTYYRFYDNSLINEQNYETYEGWSEYQENENYWKVFADVLLDTISILSKEVNEPKNTIFISDKNKAYYHNRNTIKRELKAYGSEIFPDEDFSIEANYMSDPEEFFMKKCDLAIHFPDEFIGLTREQRKKAFDKCSNIKRLIWFSPVESQKPEKKAHYSELKVQLKPYPNIEAVESTIEEFKEIVKENITKIKISTEVEKESLKELIYVISDSKIDKANFDDLLRNKNISEKFELKLIDNVENVTDYRHLHYELLRKADYFFILFFKNNLPWLSSMSAEIKKAPGFRNEKEILGKYILFNDNTIFNREKLKDFQLIPKNKPEELFEVVQNLAV
ncbi:hypothetical protein [Marivirga arenosa]|uniref:TIR domain-containing protein n=1 Tax=Marivirga arenosa TaxID=3059076 RepID=A0AA51ZY19_9BACT|nr:MULTISPECIES: hypothetical protein [unclassified Marivirga]WMN06987.1 hypothetical protein QYS48_34515 [Marivirga sp. ABR2-2]WNB18838.1 hypothetical protein QYS47_31530 [Marivirga sp. BKB1-2]